MGYENVNPATPPPTAWYRFRDPIFLLAAGFLMFGQFMTPKQVLQPAMHADGTRAER